MNDINWLKIIQGVIDRWRGKPSSYPLSEGLAEHAIQKILERYADLDPTLAFEKLAELHGVVLAKEPAEGHQYTGCDQCICR